jgi:hypothetical protein
MAKAESEVIFQASIVSKRAGVDVQVAKQIADAEKKLQEFKSNSADLAPGTALSEILINVLDRQSNYLHLERSLEDYYIRDFNSRGLAIMTVHFKKLLQDNQQQLEHYSFDPGSIFESRYDSLEFDDKELCKGLQKTTQRLFKTIFDLQRLPGAVKLINWRKRDPEFAKICNGLIQNGHIQDDINPMLMANPVGAFDPQKMRHMMRCSLELMLAAKLKGNMNKIDSAQLNQLAEDDHFDIDPGGQIRSDFIQLRQKINQAFLEQLIQSPEKESVAPEQAAFAVWQRELTLQIRAYSKLKPGP